MVLLSLSVLFLLFNLILSFFLVGRVVSRLRPGAFKYLVTRALLLTALISAPFLAWAATSSASPWPLSGLVGSRLLRSLPILIYLAVSAVSVAVLLRSTVQRIRRLRTDLWARFFGGEAASLASGFRRPEHLVDLKARLLGPLASSIYRPVLRRVSIVIERLPAPLSGLTVLFISDTHYGIRCGLEFYDALLPDLCSLNAQLVLHGGDIVSMEEAFLLAASWLGRLAESSRLGAYCVFGNHDVRRRPEALTELLEQNRSKRLSNRSVTLSHNGASFRLIGVEEPWVRASDLDALFEPERDRPDAPPLFTLALAHDPDTGVSLARLGADLVLCGHTHGGQIRLAGLGPLVIPSRHGRKYDHGLFSVHSSLMVVSCGLGSYVPPGRLGCPAEALLLTLSSTEEATLQ